MAICGTLVGGEEKANKKIPVCPGQSVFRLALCLLLLGVPLGCAHTRPSPLADETKARLGTIGVVSADVPPDVDYRTPGRGGAGGAAIGTAKGLGLGILGAAACFFTYGYAAPACVVGLATPYLAVRYAVDQATEGVAPDTIDAAEKAVNAVLAERKHQAVAADELFRVATMHTGQKLVLLPDPGPTASSEASRYRHLADQGIDTVLEITVQRIALSHQGGAGGGIWSIRGSDLNPNLWLVVTAQRRVVSTADGGVLYEHTGDHTGKFATFTDWGANDAQRFREGLDQLFREMAGEIVAQVFGVSVPSAVEPAAPATLDPTTESEPGIPSSSGEVEGPGE